MFPQLVISRFSNMQVHFILFLFPEGGFTYPLGSPDQFPGQEQQRETFYLKKKF